MASTAARGLFGAAGERCQSKAVRSGELEAMVWTDVEEFGASPAS